jgi:hypothetical protein
MSKREKVALEILQAGGYFRKQLERGYFGREQYTCRLYTAEKCLVKGVGFQTFFKFEKARLLKWRPTEMSSVWPEEWVLG